MGKLLSFALLAVVSSLGLVMGGSYGMRSGFGNFGMMQHRPIMMMPSYGYRMGTFGTGGGSFGGGGGIFSILIFLFVFVILIRFLFGGGVGGSGGGGLFGGGSSSNKYRH